jgi:segregation and condensation protein B
VSEILASVTDEAADADLDLADAATLRAAVEAVLFLSDTPLAALGLAAALERPVADVEAALAALGAELDLRGSGVELRAVAGGYRLYTRDALAPAVERFLQEGQRSRLTQAALETLAVIAYRQPVSRGRVSAIRGVNVDAVVRTLLSRGLVTEVGSDPDTGAGLFATTELFLEKLGLSGLDELPSLAPLMPDVDEIAGIGESGELDRGR